MTDDILDIAQWEQKYPFLKNVSKAYDEFNNNEYLGTSRYAYESLCYSIINKVDRNVEKHKDICIKLMRNLGHHDVNTKFYNPSHYRCNILYNWIYNTIKNSDTPNELIIKCFEDYISIMSETGRKYNCSYDLFNSTYLEPRKITILNIFDNNIPDIIVKLNGEYNLNDSPSQKYVCECVNIYKEMHMKYCNDQYAGNTDPQKTCELLNFFKMTYMQYFYTKLDHNDKIPSLDNVEEEYMRKCQKNQDVSAFAFSDGDSAPKIARLTTDLSGKPGTLLTSEAITDGDRANSLSPTVSTALGTVAGASSLLALLYKFTPAKRLVHSGFGGNIRRISSNLYAEGPSELLFDGMEHNDFNSYTIGYEAI